MNFTRLNIPDVVLCEPEVLEMIAVIFQKLSERTSWTLF